MSIQFSTEDPDEIPKEGYDIFIQYRDVQPNSRESGLGTRKTFDSALGEYVGLQKALESEEDFALYFDSDEGFVTLKNVKETEQDVYFGEKIADGDLREFEELVREQTQEQNQFGHVEGPDWNGLVTLTYDDGENVSTVTYENNIPETLDHWMYETLHHFTDEASDRLTDESFDPEELKG